MRMNLLRRVIRACVKLAIRRILRCLNVLLASLLCKIVRCGSRMFFLYILGFVCTHFHLNLHHSMSCILSSRWNMSTMHAFERWIVSNVHVTLNRRYSESKLVWEHSHHFAVPICSINVVTHCQCNKKERPGSDILAVVLKSDHELSLSFSCFLLCPQEII
jgi:hypothetical protein